MKRWSTKNRTMVENPAVDAFLEEIEAVCKKHGFEICHEDDQGAFEIWRYGARGSWIQDATDCTDDPRLNPQPHPYAAPKRPIPPALAQRLKDRKS